MLFPAYHELVVWTFKKDDVRLRLPRISFLARAGTHRHKIFATGGDDLESISRIIMNHLESRILNAWLFILVSNYADQENHLSMLTQHFHSSIYRSAGCSCPEFCRGKK